MLEAMASCFNLYRGFKLATSTFVLSILVIDFYNHILQELHFDYITCTVSRGFIKA